MIKDYFKLSFRGIIKRGLRSWLTMIGIFIGIAAIVSLISLGNGLEQAITSQFSSLGSDKLTISAKGGFGMPGQGVLNPVTVDDAEAIEDVVGVDSTITRILEPVKIEINDVIEYRALASIPEDTKLMNILLDSMGLKIEKGRMLEQKDNDKIVVAYDYYKPDNVFKKQIIVGDRILINDRKYDVIGLLGKSGNPLMDGAVLMMDGPLRELIDDKERVDVIVAVVAAGFDPNKVALDIEKTLRKRRDVKEGKEDFTVQTPKQLFETVGTILAVVQVILIGIAAISLLVGGIGITNTMYTSVLERTRDIGIMKSIGARNKDILLLYLIESGLLGLTGGIVGIAAGIFLSKTVEIVANNFGISLLKAEFSLMLILFALFFSFIVGVAAGVLPARQASKLQPVEALRKK
ncbi:ABC transporter permease [Candidatus Woesearchaeota archaeon]|nr:ABC transporter permease [Candidatus Woesearchaeota archaeon]